MDEQAFRARLASGEWPDRMSHAVTESGFYDYSRVRVVWSGGSVVEYRIGADRTGIGADSALRAADGILSARAAGRHPT